MADARADAYRAFVEKTLECPECGSTHLGDTSTIANAVFFHCRACTFAWTVDKNGQPYTATAWQARQFGGVRKVDEELKK